MGILILVVVMLGLSAAMATPAQHEEARLRMNRIGKPLATAAAVMVAVWIYIG